MVINKDWELISMAKKKGDCKKGNLTNQQVFIHPSVDIIDVVGIRDMQWANCSKSTF